MPNSWLSIVTGKIKLVYATLSAKTKAKSIVSRRRQMMSDDGWLTATAAELPRHHVGIMPCSPATTYTVESGSAAPAVVCILSCRDAMILSRVQINFAWHAAGWPQVPVRWLTHAAISTNWPTVSVLTRIRSGLQRVKGRTTCVLYICLLT